MTNIFNKSPGNAPDGHQKIEPKTARTLLVIAAALLIIALVWRFVLEKNSFSGSIVRSLAQHGCNIEADELYKHNFAKNTSIRALVGDTDMTHAADVSRECGFDAEIDKIGDVYVLLANLGDEQVLTVYVVDETIQLAFIQIPNSDSVLPISACGDAEPTSTAA